MTFVEGKKGYGLNLLLGYMRLDNETIRDAILELDEEKEVILNETIKQTPTHPKTNYNTHKPVSNNEKINIKPKIDKYKNSIKENKIKNIEPHQSKKQKMN